MTILRTLLLDFLLCHWTSMLNLASLYDAENTIMLIINQGTSSEKSLYNCLFTSTAP